MDSFDGTAGGNPPEGGSGGNYVIRGEPGPEVRFPSRGDYVLPAAGLVSRLDTSATRWLDVTGYAQPSWSESVLASEGGSGSVTYELQLPAARDPDDGTAGVPARI